MAPVGLTPPPLRCTLDSTMPAGFDAAFAKVKELVADFRANEKFHLSPACREILGKFSCADQLRNTVIKVALSNSQRQTALFCMS
jgi:hypothetical protein